MDSKELPPINSRLLGLTGQNSHDDNTEASFFRHLLHSVGLYSYYDLVGVFESGQSNPSKDIQTKLSERDTLKLENEKLKKEVERLKALLKEHNIDPTPPATVTSPASTSTGGSGSKDKGNESDDDDFDSLN